MAVKMATSREATTIVVEDIDTGDPGADKMFEYLNI